VKVAEQTPTFDEEKHPINLLSLRFDKQTKNSLKSTTNSARNQLERAMRVNSVKGSSINDVTALGGRWSQGFCDNRTKALVIKFVVCVKNNPNLRDVIYGRPLREKEKH